MSATPLAPEREPSQRESAATVVNEFLKYYGVTESLLPTNPQKNEDYDSLQQKGAIRTVQELQKLLIDVPELLEHIILTPEKARIFFHFLTNCFRVSNYKASSNAPSEMQLNLWNILAVATWLNSIALPPLENDETVIAGINSATRISMYKLVTSLELD